MVIKLNPNLFRSDASRACIDGIESIGIRPGKRYMINDSWKSVNRFRVQGTSSFQACPVLCFEPFPRCSWVFLEPLCVGFPMKLLGACPQSQRGFEFARAYKLPLLPLRGWMFRFRRKQFQCRMLGLLLAPGEIILANVRSTVRISAILSVQQRPGQR